jgi:hypothetical protein
MHPIPGTTTFAWTLVNQCTCHLSHLHSFLKHSHFCALGRGHMAPHASNTSANWGLGSLTVLHYGVNCGNDTCVGFRHKKCPEARLLTQEVCFGEPKTTSLKEENGRRPNFFIFWPDEVPKKPN